MVRHHDAVVALLSLLAASVSAIVGGDTTTDNRYSFTAAVLSPAAEQDPGDRDCTSFLCDAVLVSPTTAITASECMEGADPSELVLRVGLTPTTQTNMTISKIIPMPDFNSITLENDIAVIQLSSPVPSNISIAQLPVPNTNISSTLQILGWGPTSLGVQAISTTLQSANTTLDCDDDCAAKLGSCFSLDRTELICTSSTTQGETAYGDAGGPVVDETGAVVALIIGSPSCAQSDSLGLKLRLDGEAVQAFIRNNTVENTRASKAGGQEENGMGYVSWYA